MCSAKSAGQCENMFVDADEAAKMTPERFRQEKMACSAGMAVRKRQ